MSLLAHLEAVLAGCDVARRRAADPVAFVHRFTDPVDQEVVGLFAACLAYGRVELIARALEEVLRRTGPAPAMAARGDDLAAAEARFQGFVYRLTRGEDVARLWLGVGHLLREFPSLGAAFRAGDVPGTPDLRPALVRFCQALGAPTAHLPPRRGFQHLLADPRGPSPVKRLNLFLRWMVRGPDAIDLGLWADLDPARLVIPLDTHVHRISRYLGLTTRRAADGRTAVEITAGLARLDPADPLRFDFALAHLGMSQDCRRKRVEEVCQRCPLEGVCRLDARGEPTRPVA
ncbi:MAG: TIGR02757 family protein [bacterium]